LNTPYFEGNNQPQEEGLGRGGGIISDISTASNSCSIATSVDMIGDVAFERLVVASGALMKVG
jgi:hypothetical protein